MDTASWLRYLLAMTREQTDKRVGHTDIQLIGWWQKLPLALHPYLFLARFDRPIGWWLLLLPAWWIIPLAAETTLHMVQMMTLFLLGAMTMRGVGCVVNDMWDRRIDLRVERTSGRPLASGTVSLLQALLFLALLCLIGLGILVQLPQTAIMVGVASLPLIIIYPLAKRVTWWPQAILGLTFSWGVPLGWAAVTDQWPTPEIWLIYAGSVAWVFGYDTIYAVQDMADDRVAGVKSSALGLGDRLNLGVQVAFCLAIALISAGIQAHQGPGHWMFGVVLMAIHLLRQARMVSHDDPQGALALFKSNRNAGLILTLFLIIDRLFG